MSEYAISLAPVPDLAVTRRGSGPPLVLLHPLGSSRHVWDPILPALAKRFEVIAVDLPGFGDSEPLPSEVEPTPAALAAAVAAYLDDWRIKRPHVVGNSLGGWIALEVAHLRSVASVTLLSPAGFWQGFTPMYCRVSLWLSRWACKYASGPLRRILRYRLGRLIALGQTHGRPFAMTREQARAAVDALGQAVGFDAAMRATHLRRYERRGRSIAAPVTIAFGSRDVLLLPWQSRHLGELPAETIVAELPRCGHLPVADDPAAVTSLILESTSRALQDSAVEAGI